LSTLEWSDPFWLKRSEIAQDKAFLFGLKEGSYEIFAFCPNSQAMQLITSNGKYCC